jgi:4-carboxymuconolactone decarboxylase
LRVPTIPPRELSAEQRPLYENMVEEIKRDFKGFKAIAEDGALIGPFNVWVQRPAWGRPIWELLKVVSVSPALPRAVREVAILVTGAHFRSAYEIYAHVALAESRGLDDDKISTIVAGQRPNTLTREEAIAYDVTSALVSGYVLPEVTYRQAVETFGTSSVMELIYLVGVYCFVSVTLNGFDVPVPDDAAQISP